MRLRKPRGPLSALPISGSGRAHRRSRPWGLGRGLGGHVADRGPGGDGVGEAEGERNEDAPSERVKPFPLCRASLVAQTGKRLPAMRETGVRSPGREDPLEKGTATHSRALALENSVDGGAW